MGMGYRCKRLHNLCGFWELVPFAGGAQESGQIVVGLRFPVLLNIVTLGTGFSLGEVRCSAIKTNKGRFLRLPQSFSGGVAGVPSLFT
jgi:hypothetical protein